jgi:mannose-6-phosphate isomerase-like protein (cupin superfamily)
LLDGLATVKVPSSITRGHWSRLVELLSPAGSATPLHRHHEEDEAFYILSGTAAFHCDGKTLTGNPGDFLFLPVGLPHAYIVGPDEPLRMLTLSGVGTPSGFDKFVQHAGEPARERRLPDPAPFDPEVLGHAAAQHGIEILGPPPQPT